MDLRKPTLLLLCIYIFSVSVLLLSIPLTLAKTSTVQIITQNETEENQINYHVKVECIELAPREAEIRAYHNQNSNGTVIFVSGGFGRGWYDDGNEETNQTLNSLRENGYETFEIKWL